jgi:hypothetical protein
MFWVVDDELWIEKTPLQAFRDALGEVNYAKSDSITFAQAHFRVWKNWCAKHGYNVGDESFMYQPRGRVSYSPKSNMFELVIDPCLIGSKHEARILKECGISRKDTRILKQSGDQNLHYICKTCRPDVFDSKRREKYGILENEQK